MPPYFRRSAPFLEDPFDRDRVGDFCPKMSLLLIPLSVTKVRGCMTRERVPTSTKSRQIYSH